MTSFVGRPGAVVPGGGSGGGGTGGGSSGGTGTPPPVDPDALTVTYEYTGDGSGLNAALNAHDGDVVGLEVGGDYDLGTDGQIHIEGKSVSLIMRGSTISRPNRGDTPIIRIDGGGNSRDFGWYNGLILGAKPDDELWDVDYEHEHGILLGGVRNAIFSGVHIQDVGGDALNVQGGGGIWSDGIRFTGADITNAGRMCFCVYDGAQDVVMDTCNITKICYHTIDFEPNGATVAGVPAGATNIRFLSNVLTGKIYGDHVADPTQAAGYFLVFTDASGDGPAKSFRIEDNTLESPMKIGAFGLSDIQDLQVLNNVSTGAFEDDADFDHCIDLNGVVGVRITGNTQPLDSGDFIHLSGCGGTIVITPNTTP